MEYKYIIKLYQQLKLFSWQSMVSEIIHHLNMKLLIFIYISDTSKEMHLHGNKGKVYLHVMD
jgi:hypothetical protein